MSRVVSVFFCAVYIVLLGQCYVAMPSGYKLVITRALGLHGIYCTQPSGLAPSCFSAIYSIHPSCPCYNYNLHCTYYDFDVATVSTKQSFTKKCTVYFLCLSTISSTHAWSAEVTFSLVAVMYKRFQSLQSSSTIYG